LNNKPVIVTDVDSVLLDWLLGFTLFLQSKGFDTSHITQHLGTTNFIPIPVITKLNCAEKNKFLVKEFSKSEFIYNLPAFNKNDIIHIKELSNHFDFIALSCISKNKKMQKMRTLNLTSIYGNIFLDVLCIGYGQSKAPYLSELKKKHNVYTFVDDKISHIEESISEKIRPILFSNGVPLAEDHRFKNLESWMQIKEHAHKDGFGQ